MDFKLIPIVAMFCIFLNSQVMLNTAMSLPQKDDDVSANATISTSNHSALINVTSEKILSRQKRFPLAAVVIGILTGAATTGGGYAIGEYVRASAPDECAITIKYYSYYTSIPRGSSSSFPTLNMNFKSTYNDNWNNEKLDSYGSGIDTTKEKVTGGHLKLIQIYPEKGKFCIEGIIISCGSQLNRRNTERSVILDVPTIRKAWFRQGNPRFLDVNWEKNCLWFTREDYRSVRAIDVYPYAFTDCENASEDCISGHIEVF